MTRMSSLVLKSLGVLVSVGLLGLLLTPLLGLLFSVTPSSLLQGVRHPLFLQALWLSLQSTLLSLAVILVTGTPLSWWLAHRQGPLVDALELLTRLPMIIPPAVVGVALLQIFGSQGMLGGLLKSVGVQIPFTTYAVILAQVIIAAPFYIQSASSAFRRVDHDLLLVARTLGQTTHGAFFRIALPLALPGLLGGAILAWGRSLGEFGATLLFAGNFPGRTQTMPLAIYTALESDVRVAVALSLFLAGAAIFLLFVLKWLPSFQTTRQPSFPAKENRS